MYTSMVDISNISPRVILKLLNAAETYQVSKSFEFDLCNVDRPRLRLGYLIQVQKVKLLTNLG